MKDASLYRIEVTVCIVDRRTGVELWEARVFKRLGFELQWRSALRLSPEGAAYLAKRWLMDKPDIKEKPSSKHVRAFKVMAMGVRR